MKILAKILGYLLVCFVGIFLSSWGQWYIEHWYSGGLFMAGIVLFAIGLVMAVFTILFEDDLYRGKSRSNR